MRKLILLFILSSLLQPLFAQTTVAVDVTQEHQTIQGFGAFGGIKPYWEAPPFYTNDFLDYFLDDLGATIVRTNIFWDLEPVNDNSSPGNLDLSKFNYKAGSNLGRQIPYYIALKEAGLEKLIATSWTPPDWMKLHDDPDRIPDQCYNCNNCPTTDPRRKVCGGRLDPKYYHEYAEYLLAYVMILKQETGIDLYGISIQNEPYFANPFESNVVKPEEYGNLLDIVGKRFRDEGLGTKLFGPEHMAEWSWGVQQNYVSNIFSNGGDNPYLDIYAVHGYVDGVAPDYGSAAGWTALKENIADKYDKRIWMTETSGYPQSFAGAMDLAKSMYLALRFGDISAWVYWSVSGEPGSEFSLMASGEPTPVYYVSRQFFKYIRPGAIRITATSGDAEVLALAFKNPSEGSMTLVLVNTSDQEKNIALDIPVRPAEFFSYRTSANENSVETGSVVSSVIVPPKSVTTLVGYGAAAPSIDDIRDYYLHVGDDNSLEVPISGITDGNGGSLGIDVISSNEALVAAPHVSYQYPATQGTLSFTPNTSSAGKSVITVRLTNNRVLNENDFAFNTREISFTISVSDMVTNVKKKVETELRIFPNPVNSDILLLDLSGLDHWRRVEVTNSNGQKVFSLENSPSMDKQITLDTEKWIPGIYFIQVTAGWRRIIEKIIVN